METNKKPEQYKAEIIGSVKRGRGRPRKRFDPIPNHRYQLQPPHRPRESLIGVSRCVFVRGKMFLPECGRDVLLSGGEDIFLTTVRRFFNNSQSLPVNRLII